MKGSRWIGLAAAGLCAALVWPHVWKTGSAPGAVRAAGPQAREPARTEAVTDFVSLLQRKPLQAADGAPFEPTSWEPPASAKQVPPPLRETPAPATVPTFPYRYAGRLDLDRTLHQVYLARRNGEVLAVTPGDVIDGLWRIDRVTSEHIDVTYVPLTSRLALTLADLTRDEGSSTSSAAGPIAAPSDGEAALERRRVAPERAHIASGVARENSLIATGGAGLPLSAMAAGRALGVPATSPTGRLGDDAPVHGSMPTGSDGAERNGMNVADAASRGFPAGAIPSGRLGEATPTGKLGQD